MPATATPTPSRTILRASSRSSATRSGSRPARAIDFETDQSHDITVQTTDAAGNTYSEVVTISGQRPDRREPDRHHPDRRLGRRECRGGHDGCHAVDGRRGCGRQPHLRHHQRSRRASSRSSATKCGSRPARHRLRDRSDHTTSRSRPRTGGRNTTPRSSPSRSTTCTMELRRTSPDRRFRRRGCRSGRTVATLSRSTSMPATATPMPSPTIRPASSRSSADEVRVAAGAHIDFETDQSHDITIETTDAAATPTVKSSRSASTTWSTRPRPTSPSPAVRSTRMPRPVRRLPRCHGRCGRRRQPHLRHHQRPVGLLRDRRQRSAGRGRRHHRLRDRPVHDITIETTDASGNTYSEVVTISVNDLNEDPTDITLTGGAVDEGARPARRSPR